MFFIGKKENRRFLNNKEQKTVLSVKNFFKFNNVKTIKEQFVAKLKVDFIQKDAFVLRDRVYYLLIDEELISEKDVIKLLRKYSDVKSFNIICSSYDNSAQDFVDNLLDIDVNLIDAKKLVIEYKFDVSEVKNQIKFKQSRRTSFKDFLKLLINKENFKGYFISGLVLFFYSLFFKQSLYYYIFGSTLFLLAFACKFISRAKYVKKF